MRVERKILSSRLDADGRSWIRLNREQRRARSEFLAEFGDRDYWSRSSCPGCGARESVLIARKDLYGLPADNHLCRGCGLIFKNPLLTTAATGAYYEKISFRLRGKDPSPRSRAALFRMRARTFAAERFAFVRRYFPELPAGSLVVEIGTYDGANLVPFLDAGHRVAGYDIDDGAFGPGREAGLTLRTGVPGEIVPEEKPALVIASHFVEHLVRPLEQLRAIRSLLPERGRLFVEVPGVREIGAKDLLGYFMTEHNFSFDLSSLRTLVEAAGFSLCSGDEVVRALFGPGPAPEPVSASGENADALLAVLERAEKRYRGWGARAFYHRLRVFGLNEILYRLSF